MLKRYFLLCSLAVLVAAVSSCIFDPQTPPPTPPPKDTQKFENLTEKWHVLNNLELAYNRRDITKYQEILDPNFTFFLTPGDVGGGLPKQWGAPQEIQYTTLLFATDPGGGFPRCKSIQMDVQFSKDQQWVEVTQPTEKWYTATVFYDFKFEVDPDITYINNPGAKAQFTVRNAGTDAAPHWQLVESRDLGDAN